MELVAQDEALYVLGRSEAYPVRELYCALYVISEGLEDSEDYSARAMALALERGADVRPMAADERACRVPGG